MLRPLLYTALAVGAVYFLGKGKTARYMTGVRVQIRGVAPVGINEMQVTFNIDNPNVKDSIIKSVVGDVYVNGRKVGRVASYNQVIVKGNSSSIYPVTVKMLPVRAVMSIVELVKGVANSQIVFDGTVNIDNTAQAVKRTYQI